jgi:hypothetical protein
VTYADWPTRSASCVNTVGRLPSSSAAGGRPDERLTNVRRRLATTCERRAPPRPASRRCRIPSDCHLNRSTRSSGRPSRQPDLGPESGADQRERLPLVGVVFCCRVTFHGPVTAQPAQRRPRKASVTHPTDPHAARVAQSALPGRIPGRRDCRPDAECAGRRHPFRQTCRQLVYRRRCAPPLV